jgi:uncharacterized protein (DUF1501 family)
MTPIKHSTRKRLTNGQRPALARKLTSRDRLLTRRGFIAASGVVGAAGIAGGSAWAALADSAGARSAASTAPSGTAGTLVLITLYGGNDGLDTVVPVTDPAYQKARGELAVAPKDAHPLADGLSFHPSLARLARRYGDGGVAIVRGVGYPAPDHSHFRSMSIWQTASPQTASPTGWLGRWLDTTSSSQASAAGGPIQAVGIGPTLTPALVGARRSAAAVPVGPLAVPGGALGSSIRALYQAPRESSEGALLQSIAGVDADYLSVADRLGKLLPAAADTGRANDLGSQLDVVGTLINAGVPTQAYAVSLGGFDTHTGEEQTHAGLLAEVDSAVDAFLTSVARAPQADRLVVMIYSEFGRRVATNAGGGTDHGTAAPVILAGPGVRGGMYGDQPSLTKLGTGDDEGDLIATTDFRDVYATVLADVLNSDPSAALGSGRRTLGFVKA